MKKINFFLLALLMSTSVLLTSCGEDDPIIDPQPTMDFKGGATYTSSDVTIQAGQSILVGINAAQNSATKEKLTNFTIVLTANNIPTTLIDETLTNNQEAVYSQDFNITFPNVGVVRLAARITDSDGQYSELSFNVTVEQAGVAVKKKSNLELGSFNDAVGSFYATATEEIFTVTTAKQNQSKVDMIFFKGVTNGNAFGAPSDPVVNSISDFQLDTWVTKNATKFIKVAMTAAEFDAIGTVYEFPEFNDATATTLANQLANGNVVYFKTVAGKKGYFKVVDLYSRGDLAKFDVIVEQ